MWPAWAKSPARGCPRGWRLRGDLPTLRQLVARIDLSPPELDAPGAIHPALADDLGEQEVGEQIDLARLQGGWRGRHGDAARIEVRLLHAVTTSVCVGELVERR